MSTTTSGITSTSGSAAPGRSGAGGNRAGGAGGDSGDSDVPLSSGSPDEGRSVRAGRRTAGAGAKGSSLGVGRHHILVRTPFGGLYVVAAADSVVGIYHEDHDPEPSPARLGQPLPPRGRPKEDDPGSGAAATEASAADTGVLYRAHQELAEYFDGRRRCFGFRMATAGTAFQEEVWRALARIPFGERRSYRDIATSLGNPMMGRAIGAAVRANPLSIAIPGHRVVSSSGKVVGYAAGAATKSALLDFELSACAASGPTVIEASAATSTHVESTAASSTPMDTVTAPSPPASSASASASARELPEVPTPNHPRGRPGEVS